MTGNFFRLLTTAKVLEYSNKDKRLGYREPFTDFHSSASTSHRIFSVKSIRACTGFDGGFEVWEAIRGLRNRVPIWNLKLNADNNELAYAA